MKKLRVYVDTSVIGGCLDEEFAEPSRALLNLVREGKMTLLISDLLADELAGAPTAVKEVFDSLPEECIERLQTCRESELLRDNYIANEVVAPSSRDDAHHVALATVARADMIVSWNFRHIVHFEKMRGFNSVNLREGYQPIEIHSPREVV
jgi:predicted nucleic acid-binding protein